MTRAFDRVDIVPAASGGHTFLWTVNPAFSAPLPWKFSVQRGHTVGRAPTQDNLVVFYLPEPEDWEAAVSRMRRAGFKPVPSYNPYWDIMGATFEDADGYRVVFQRAHWQDAV